MTVTEKSTNRILAALPKKEYGQLFPKLDRVRLTFGENILEPGDIIRYFYFPESGIISLLSGVDPDYSVEIGMVGSEGVAGVPAFLGVKTSGSRAIVQGSGFAQKVSVPQFRAACKNGGKLNGLMNLYVHALLTQISQSAVCNGFHPIEARLARWLLMTHDRMQADEFQITQSFLSKMVGVRREAVNKAVGALQNRELIAYRRGNLTVKDRKGLENASCDCYALIKKEGERY